jgi:hypothetical protein
MKTKTKQLTPVYGLCLDWETSGSTWGGDSSIKYQGLSFGAIIFDAKTFKPVEKLYREIQFEPTKYEWNMGAQAIHGLTQEYLLEHGVTQQEAAIDLASLILKYFGDAKEARVMFMGHNPEFDRLFTNQLLNVIELEFSINRSTNFEGWIQMHHVMLDTSALGFITLGLYKSDLLFEKIGFAERADHNALTDAEQTLETCAVIREIVNSVMEPQ